MIKAIIFDCFGVLTVDRWLEFCESITDRDIREEARSFNYLYDAGKMPLEEFIEKMAKLSGRDKQEIISIFTNPVAAKNVELIDYIRSLKPKYKIGMLSNVATNWVREVLLTAEEQKLFDAMVFSYEIRAGKPDAIAYKTALEKLQVTPEDAVFIDDLLRYVEGAKKQGIKSIQYKSFPQMKKDLEPVLAGSND